MADTTGIAWTDSTFNPWWGCTKIAPGCDFCYAAELDKKTGGDHWDNAYRTMSNHYWNNPNRWQKFHEVKGGRRKVFCGSMCDWTDNKAPEGQLDRLWAKIRMTPLLDWQLLTKRANNIERCLPPDWDQGYDNVWLGVTVENKSHGLARLERLRNVPAKVRFLSIEPLLEDIGVIDLTGIHWVIVGGESGPKARSMSPEWVYSIMRQCQEQDVPFFFKQWGGRDDKGGCLLEGREFKQWPRVSSLPSVNF